MQEGPQEYRLPDGRVVSVAANEAVQLGACLLRPSLMGISGPSVAEVVAAGVFTHLDPAVRKVGPEYVLM